MLKNKIILPLLAAVSVLSTTPAFADHFRDFRCERAQQNLSNAQNALNQAVLLLSQVQNICGGAIACIITAQNHYNQTVMNVQQAQEEVRWACQPRWPRPRPFPGGRGGFPGDDRGGFPGGGDGGFPDGGRGGFPGGGHGGFPR